MLAYNDIKPRTYIVMDGEPYEVISAHVFRKQQRRPVNQTKLKSLKTGKVTAHSFAQSDKIEEADMQKRDVKYLYNNRGAWWFCEVDNPKERFELSQDLIGARGKFMKENEIVQALTFEGNIIGITPPIKVTLQVKEAPPGIRGDTAQGGSKRVVLETGTEITTPLFINTGDSVVVNTETGEYVERA